MASPTPTWLITGCSSGFGYEIALVALHAGHNVIATSRNPSKTSDAVSAVTSKPNGKWLALDVTAPQESINKTIAEAESLLGPIDILVNNAGYSVLGAAEEIPEDVARKQYETNYWAPFEDYSGRPAEHEEEEERDDRESLSESLAVELQTFSIRVLLVEPGAFRTKFLTTENMQLPPASAVYKGTAVEETVQKFQTMNGKQASDPVKGAQRIFEVVMGTGMGKGKTAYLRCIIGPDCLDRATKQVESVKENLVAMQEIAGSTKFDE